MVRLSIAMLLISLAAAESVLAQRGRYADVPPASTGEFQAGPSAEAGDLGPPPSNVEEPAPVEPMQPLESMQPSGTSGSSAQPVQPNNRQQPTDNRRDLRQPTGASAPPAHSTTVDDDTAQKLMAAMLRRPSSSQLVGSPISLHQVVSTASSRSEQSQCVEAYWDLCSSVSDYYLSLHEQHELERLATTAAGLESVVERQRVRRDTALTAARASQHQLASLMNRTGITMPLPSDLPLCGIYKTKFNQNFTAGSSQEAVELNRLIPLRYKELLAAGENVLRSERHYDQAAVQSVEQAVVALELLALNRRAFVQIAKDYNRRITRYTELARPGELASGKLVSMLIKTETATASRPNGAGRQSQFGPPPTFRELPAGDGIPRLNDRDLQPAGHDAPAGSATSRGERSVLRAKRTE